MIHEKKTEERKNPQPRPEAARTHAAGPRPWTARAAAPEREPSLETTRRYSQVNYQWYCWFDA
ncbi:MAG: hypothetical protein PHY12_04325 [Eubacteriales bacterium]|nr:hypothetical protein [Eubacteriales bacterium]